MHDSLSALAFDWAWEKIDYNARGYLCTSHEISKTIKLTVNSKRQELHRVCELENYSSAFIYFWILELYSETTKENIEIQN